MKTTDLQETLKALAAETAEAEASPAIRSALLAELAKRRKPHTTWRDWLWKAWPVAAAACLVAGFWIGTSRRPSGGPAMTPTTEAAVVEPAPAYEAPQTVPEPIQAELTTPAVRHGGGARGASPQQALGSGLEYMAATPWYFHAGLPTPATGRVIRMEVSAATAQQFGVYTSRKTADAEILMGDDGLARAIRFLRPVTRSAVVRASSRQE